MPTNLQKKQNLLDTEKVDKKVEQDPKLRSLRRVEDILNLVTESLTRDEFVASFEKVVNFVKKIKEANDRAILNLENDIQTKLADSAFALREDHKEIFDDTKALIKEEADKAFEEQSSSLNFIRDKIRSIKDGKDGEDGKDADEDSIVEKLKVLIPEQYQLPQDLIDQIEALEKDHDAFKKELEGLRKRGKLGGGGTSDASVKFSLGRVIQKETPSGLINSSNKIYTTKGTINSVLSLVINGQNITDDEYTVTGKGFTMTNALDESLSGTSYRICYV